MKPYFKNRVGIIAILLMLASEVACGVSTDWSFGAASSSASTSKNAPNQQKFFDIWTIEVMPSPLSCPVIQSGLTGTKEEYRIYETNLGCSVATSAPDGTALAGTGKLFDAGSDCLVDNNSITLERKFKVNAQDGSACTNSANYTARLESTDDSSILSGEMTGYIKYSASCANEEQKPEDCDFRMSIRATRGRSANSLASP